LGDLWAAVRWGAAQSAAPRVAPGGKVGEPRNRDAVPEIVFKACRTRGIRCAKRRGIPHVPKTPRKKASTRRNEGQGGDPACRHLPSSRPWAL